MGGTCNLAFLSACASLRVVCGAPVTILVAGESRMWFVFEVIVWVSSDLIRL